MPFYAQLLQNECLKKKRKLNINIRAAVKLRRTGNMDVGNFDAHIAEVRGQFKIRTSNEQTARIGKGYLDANERVTTRH